MPNAPPCMRGVHLSPTRLIFLFAAFASTPLWLQGEAAPRITSIQAFEHSSTMSLGFEANDGRQGNGVKFVTRAAGYAAQFMDHQIALFPLPHRNLRLVSKTPPILVQFPGSNPAPGIRTLEPQDSRTNYFLGNDPQSWRREVVRYGLLMYENIYPGVNVACHGMENELACAFVVEPGVDPDVIRLQFENSYSVNIMHGDLFLPTQSGELFARQPVFQQDNGQGTMRVPGRYVRTGLRGARLAHGPYDSRKRLRISIVFSRYPLPDEYEYARALTRDQQGNVILVGTTPSTDTPPGSSQVNNAGSTDVFVAKLSPAGNLLWVTYAGGRGIDGGQAATTDPAGNIYVTGDTTSTVFPSVNAVQSRPGGGGDAFVMKLDPSGSVAYSSLLGGSDLEFGLAIAVNAQGDAVVGGFTRSKDFPIHNAAQPRHQAMEDGFVLKLSAAGDTLIYSTFLGGNRGDFVNRIAVMPDGETYVAGDTTSADFPVRQALQPKLAGETDGFVARLGPGGGVAFSTYLGGNGIDAVRDVLVTPSGETWVVSETTSTDIPSLGLAAHNAGKNDILLQRFDRSATALVFSAYLGGSGDDKPQSLGRDSAGNVYIAGTTDSHDFPAVAAVQKRHGGGVDSFLMRFDPSTTRTTFSSYLGGTREEMPTDVGVDANGRTWLAGTTKSRESTSLRRIGSAIAGLQDAFLVVVETGLKAETTSPHSGSIASRPVRLSNGK